ncbi:MAG: SpoIVB peptidase S55 domain-containing protein, partial [Traorella sp.]
MKKILILPLLYLLFPIQILSKEVYLGGESIGIQIQYEGLLITSTYPIQQDTINIDPKNQDIQSGDTLLEINGNTIETLQDFTTTIKQYPNQKVEITLKRNHDIIYRMLEIIHQEGNYKTGLLLKDEITGIGTLTYIDPITKNSASLGHEILDQDTQKPISLSDGTIFGSSVNQIKKAQISRVGEKQAIILFNENLGNIHKINQFGIYGKNYPIKNNLLIETALQDEIVLEKATMYTV